MRGSAGEFYRTPWSSPRYGIEATFPEAVLLRSSLAAAASNVTASTVIAPRPALPRWCYSIARGLAGRGVFRSAAMQALLRLGFRTLRGGLFRSRGTPARIAAVTEDRIERLEVPDAMAATGQMVAATMVALSSSARGASGALPPGGSAVESVVSLDEVLAAWSELGFPSLEPSTRPIEFRSDEAPKEA